MANSDKKPLVDRPDELPDHLPLDREHIIAEINRVDQLLNLLAEAQLTLLDKVSAAKLRLQNLNMKLRSTAR